MFNDKVLEEVKSIKDILDRNEELNEIIEDLKDDKNDLEEKVQELKLEHKLAIKTLEYEIQHVEDEKLADIKAELQDEREKVKVQAKEIEMLKQLIDVNADIVDVKDLVKTLIEKLPNIDLKNITVNSGAV